MFKGPVTIPCDHTFCRECLESAMEQGGWKCPLDECLEPCWAKDMQEQVRGATAVVVVVVVAAADQI